MHVINTSFNLITHLLECINGGCIMIWTAKSCRQYIMIYYWNDNEYRIPTISHDIIIFISDNYTITGGHIIIAQLGLI